MPAFEPPITDDTRLKFLFDADGGCYKDAACTLPCTVHNDVCLGIRANASGSVIGEDNKFDTKVGAGSILWKIEDDRRYLYFPGNAFLKSLTGSIDPGICAGAFCIRPFRRNNTAEVLVDVGRRHAVGSVICVSSYQGAMCRYIGTNTACGIAPDRDWCVIGFRSNASGIKMWRANTLQAGTLASPVITSTGAATGACIANDVLGVAGAHYKGDYAALALYTGAFSDGDMDDLLEAMVAHYYAPEPLLGNDNVFITDGDSNSTCIRVTDTTKEWASIIGTTLEAEGVPNFRIISYGLAGRTLASLATYRQDVIDRALEVDGVVTYMCHITENDLQTISGATTWTNMQTHFGAIKAAAPACRIIWISPPSRTDRSGGYEAQRTVLKGLYAADPTVGGTVDGIIDIANDPNYGTTAACAEVAKFPDGIHYSDSAAAHVASLGLPVVRAFYTRSNVSARAQLVRRKFGGF